MRNLIRQVSLLLRVSSVSFVSRIVRTNCSQYADPVSDLLDKWGVFRARLFRDACVFYKGNYVKVSTSCVRVLYERERPRAL